MPLQYFNLPQAPNKQWTAQGWKRFTDGTDVAVETGNTTAIQKEDEGGTSVRHRQVPYTSTSTGTAL